MDLMTATPVEFDTALADLYGKRYALFSRIDLAIDRVHSYAGDTEQGHGARRRWTMTLDEARTKALASETSYVRKYVADYDALVEERDALSARIAEFDAAFVARGGWARGFLVTDGHVHSTMACSTCHITTQFSWLTEFSGKTEAEIVKAAADRACTICYPSAPVVASGTSTLRTKDEAEREAARAEREAKAAAKKAAEITVPDFYDYGATRRPKTFKTARAVTNALASNLGSLVSWGTEHPTSPQWERNVEVLREAIEANGIDYDYDKALANARKRCQREGGSPKF